MSWAEHWLGVTVGLVLLVLLVRSSVRRSLCAKERETEKTGGLDAVLTHPALLPLLVLAVVLSLGPRLFVLLT
jgi:hypothetical protein